MEISYSEKAVKQLKLICKGDRKSGKMIIESIEHYAANPNDKFDIKSLKELTAISNGCGSEIIGLSLKIQKKSCESMKLSIDRRHIADYD